MTAKPEHPGSAGSGELPAPRIIHSDDRALHLSDQAVDLVVNSPPFLGTRMISDNHTRCPTASATGSAAHTRTSAGDRQ